MKIFKKSISIIMVLVTLLSCVAFSASAKVEPQAFPTAMSVVTKPKKINHYRYDDWDYGYWQFPEGEVFGHFEPGGKDVCFMYYGGYYSHYSDFAILDLNGMVVKVRYSDGSEKNITYNVSLDKKYSAKNTVVENLYASPVGPKGYVVGANKVEVYLPNDVAVFTTVDINILPYALGDVNNDSKVTSADALLVLQHTVGLISLNSNQKKYADMNSDLRFNSADALEILLKIVG